MQVQKCRCVYNLHELNFFLLLLSYQGTTFKVNAGTLSISVVTYSVCAILCFILLLVRRYTKLFGRAELGGPSVTKYVSGCFLIFLWFVYVLISCLVIYDILNF